MCPLPKGKNVGLLIFTAQNKFLSARLAMFYDPILAVVYHFVLQEFSVLSLIFCPTYSDSSARPCPQG